MFRSPFSQSTQENSRSCPFCSQSDTLGGYGLLGDRCPRFNKSEEVCVLCQGTGEVPLEKFMESQLLLIREQVRKVIANCYSGKFFSMIVWGDLYHHFNSLKGENSDLPIEAIAKVVYWFSNSALEVEKQFEEKSFEIQDKETEIGDLQIKSTNLEQEILNLNEQILTLNREKCLLEWDKNEKIKKKKSQKALLKKALEEFPEAQLDWYSNIYSEYFAELEQNISEEKEFKCLILSVC